jgi:hypothetical protein
MENQFSTNLISKQGLRGTQAHPIRVGRVWVTIFTHVSYQWATQLVVDMYGHKLVPIGRLISWQVGPRRRPVR